jgi:hypothetical protein
VRLRGGSLGVVEGLKKGPWRQYRTRSLALGAMKGAV